jgi:SAM-dependent methyltransferase
MAGLTQRERDFYDQRWEISGEAPSITAAEQDRIAQTTAVIPQGCKSLLDVGCGDGRLCKEVTEKLQCFLVAFDLSTVALARLAVPKCCGSAARLPFRDRSFDLVMATEVIEHLPDALYHQVLGELARVADKYILTTVPNRENLKEHLARCPACGSQFHVWGHVRSYSPGLLKEAFSGFKSVRIFALGDRVGTYNKFLLWLRHWLADAWYWEDRTFCPTCHASDRPSPRWSFLARLCDSLNFRLWAPLFKRRGWLLGLYQREDTQVDF